MTREEHTETLKTLAEEYRYPNIEKLIEVVAFMRETFCENNSGSLKEQITNESIAAHKTAIRKFLDEKANFGITAKDLVFSAIKADESAVAYIRLKNDNFLNEASSQHEQKTDDPLDDEFAIPDEEFDGGEEWTDTSVQTEDDVDVDEMLIKNKKEKKRKSNTGEKKKLEKIVIGTIAVIVSFAVLYGTFYVYGIYKEMTSPEKKIQSYHPVEAKYDRHTKPKSRFAKKEHVPAPLENASPEEAAKNATKDETIKKKSRFAVDYEQNSKHERETKKQIASTIVKDESSPEVLHKASVNATSMDSKKEAYPPIPEESLAPKIEMGGVCSIVPKYYSKTDTYIYYVKKGNRYIPAFQDRNWDGKGIKISKRVVGLSVDSKNGLVEVKEGKFLPMELFSSCTTVEQ